jgi:hypothetical protein
VTRAWNIRYVILFYFTPQLITHSIDLIDFSAIFKNPELLKELNDKSETIYPITLEYPNESDKKKKEITDKVREFYFNNEKICDKNLKNLSNVSLCLIMIIYVHYG